MMVLIMIQMKNIRCNGLNNKIKIIIFFIRMDNEWIDEFTNKEKEYQIFYKNNINYIRIFVLYVNKNKCLDKVKEKTLHLQSANILTKNELRETINMYRKSEKVPYKLISILKHNIDIEPDDIARSLRENYEYDYTYALNTLETINFNKSINMFEDLTSVFLLFCETDNITNKNTTKRIKFKYNQTIKK
jgi:hypothetical protein